MNLQQKVYLFIIIGFIVFETAFAVCNTCGPNAVRCVNETYFNYCPDGTPSKQGAHCPDGQVCTDDQQICQPRATAKKVCGSCDTCSSGFLCTSKYQFEYCQDTIRTGITGKCPKGQYCSLANVVKNHNICVDSCLDVPTCYAAEVSTTPAPINEQDYTKSCDGAKVNGDYLNLANLCDGYVKCEILDGVVYSIFMRCNSGYFSAADKKCVATKPNQCK